ncbi:DUF1156 domain-containing protein [Pirellula sp. SH-Sr6A]|uniref:DUF1156 domain-containing protein n=1 Tax=Pirellula sp. SH-Sr6A TaxID=1632865 RepID=UPI001F0B428F|nr:hypothetical protein [Pirellula sp. SH-Sr6A]
MRQLQETLSEESRGRWEGIAGGKFSFDASSPEDMVVLRLALLDFVADFANWDNSTVPAFLETSRALTQAAHEALGGVSGTRPLLVDPFAGGGSIPLEALRVGADAFGSDLNPVPQLLNKIILEYLPKYGEKLADEVSKQGARVKIAVQKSLSTFYPVDSDGANPIAYIWARTVKCEGPACGAEIPLIRSMWLSKKGVRPVALQLIPNQSHSRIDFRIIVKTRDGWVWQDSPSSRVLNPMFEGTMKRSSATCPCCGYTTPANNVKEQLALRRGGANDARLVCIVTVKTGVVGRSFRLPTVKDLQAIDAAGNEIARLDEVKGEGEIPSEDLPYLRSIFNIHLLGVHKWRYLFSNRQLLALLTFVREIKKCYAAIDSDDHEFRLAVISCLALTLSKLTDLANSLCAWEPNVVTVQHLFGRQAMGIVWDFAEGNPIGASRGSWDVYHDNTVFVLREYSNKWHIGHSEAASADKHPLPNDSVDLFVTDPPYYDAVPYADLSDFFYVWLKRILVDWMPSTFCTELTPKKQEIVQLSERNPKYSYKTKENFERLMTAAMAEGRRVLRPEGVGVIVFAHKTTTGWETQLQSLIAAGWMITASWPIDTELATRLRGMNSAVLASSVHLVCRPRETIEGALVQSIGEWRDILAELPRRIHEWMPRLAAEGVVGADAIFACLGPALEVFSRYSRVEKANGETATLREYLEHVWAAVSSEALALIFKDVSAAGLEPDARLTAMWLWTIGGGASSYGKKSGNDEVDESLDEETGDDEENSTKAGKSKVASGLVLEYDAARKIAQGLGIHLEQSESLVEVKGDKARLIPVAERTTYLFGKGTTVTTYGPSRKKKLKQRSLFEELGEIEAAEAGWIDLQGPTPGTTVLDRVHQAMILFAGNRGELLKRFLVEDGVGKDERFWKLADNLNKLYPSGTEERRWVEGVLARKKGLGL